MSKQMKHSPLKDITIRTATVKDLEQINRVIQAAVMSWDLAERVKRLSLSSYLYNEEDFNHLQLVVAQDDEKNICGIAGWERAEEKDAPSGYTALLLHGIYVAPAYHHRSVGRRLFSSAEAAVHSYHLDGLLVKAQKDAIGFFSAQGMTPLAVQDPARNYENRFWKKSHIAGSNTNDRDINKLG